jgi:hypothetical protein
MEREWELGMVSGFILGKLVGLGVADLEVIVVEVAFHGVLINYNRHLPTTLNRKVSLETIILYQSSLASMEY